MRPTKIWASQRFSPKMMSDSMQTHDHMMSHRTQDVLLPPNLPQLYPTSGIMKMSSELI